MFRKVANKLAPLNKCISTGIGAFPSQRTAVSPVAMFARHASALVTQFEKAVASLPEREAVRYTDKNMKWTAANVKMYADAHANALLEHGFQFGDTVGVWLPDGAEKHITLLAAAQMGMKVVDFDPKISTVADLRAALGQAQCRALFFDPVNATQDKLLLLRKAIPEFYHFDDTYGQGFHSKHYPNLQYFVHTGFDLEMGCLNYKSLFLRDPEVSSVEASKAKLSDDLPLYAKGSANGGDLAWTAQKDVLSAAEWGFADKFIKKEYFETA